MDRKIVSACVLVASLSAVTPALAQTPEWSSDRPDGHAPAGVMADYTLEKSEFYIGYRYYRTEFDGTLVGTEPFFSDDVLDFFAVAPLTLQRQQHEVEMRFGLTDAITIEVAIPFIMNSMVSITEDDEFFETRSNDIGDVSGRLLIDLYEMDEYRMLLMLGATAPTSGISDRDETPLAGGAEQVLPFPMQTGVGHIDLLGGLGFAKQNDVATLGAQANLIIRSFDNSQDYRLGDQFEFTVWGAYNLSDWLSLSARALYQTLGETEGFDRRTDGAADPTANPLAQGGERVYLPFGFNLYFQDGLAGGSRLSVEYYYPVHEDLNGPQLSASSSVVASWQVVF
jgi:hypothetical protein